MIRKAWQIRDIMTDLSIATFRINIIVLGFNSLAVHFLCVSTHVMALEAWLLFLLVSIVPVVSPGPAILLAINNTLRFGRQATVWSALGNSLGLIVLGLGELMSASATAFTVLKLTGAVYLVPVLKHTHSFFSHIHKT